MKKSLYLAVFFIFLSFYASYSQTFGGQIPNGEPITNQCGNSNSNVRKLSLAVNGLKDKLSSEFGLLSVTIHATIPGKIADHQPYMELVAPGGQPYRLMDGQSFPQFDGTKQEFKVTFSACNSGGIKRANDNVPFVVNGIYRPAGDNPLNKVNLSNISPNGDWFLGLCAEKEIRIFSLVLEFGPTCATVKTHKIVTENCQSFVQVIYSEINGPFCDNQDDNKIPDYYLKITGRKDPITLWDASKHLKLAVPQGKSKIEFGTYYKNSQGIEFYSCPQIFEVDVPINDTVKPIIQNCPSNVTVTLDTDGKADYIIKHPIFSDNCGTPTSYVNINYLDGATDPAGAVLYNNLTTSPDQFVSYVIKGVGRQVIEFVTTDAAGNRATCTSVITTLPNPNSCANDAEAPFFPFG